MNRQRTNPTILQALSQFGDDKAPVIPSQAGLHRYGCMYCLHHSFSDFEQERDIPQHARTGTLAGNLLHGTAEIQVNHIRTGSLNHAGSLNHRISIPAVKLNTNRTLLISNHQFVHRRAYRAHQCLSRYELRIDHGSPETLAQPAEADIRHILHRCQEHRLLTKINIPNPHHPL